MTVPQVRKGNQGCSRTEQETGREQAAGKTTLGGGIDRSGLKFDIIKQGGNK